MRKALIAALQSQEASSLSRHLSHALASTSSSTAAPKTALASWRDILPAQGVLLRDFIQLSLYHPEVGYFTRTRGDVVGSLPAPLPFTSFWGRWGYEKAVRDAYDRLGVSWLTPSEIFQPLYGEALGRFVAENHLAGQINGGAAVPPLTIYELGAGSGVVAQNVLDFLRREHPGLYDTCRYVTVEISAPLAERQEARVGADRDHRERFAAQVRNATEPLGWSDGLESRGPCFILGLEVLDNLPHDRLVYGPSGRALETWVVPGPTPLSAPREELRPLSDPLLGECMEAVGMPAEIRGCRTRWDRPVFLPTECYRLLRSVAAARPAHTLLLSDFDSLPDVRVPGEGAPIVSCTVGGMARDYSNYLVAPGAADIFFPTDFRRLEMLYRHAVQRGPAAATEREDVAGAACGKRVVGSALDGFGCRGEGSETAVYKSRAFLERWADWRRAETRLGLFNPLLTDFENTSFFVGRSQMGLAASSQERRVEAAGPG